jgi:PAS domain S-box-containing protein
MRLSRLYWRQSLLLIVTVLLPFLANILHNLNVGPFGRVELTPFLFVLTGAVLVWGIFRFRLLDLAPIARSRIFQLMQDAVVVLDPYGRVVDANLAAERLLGQPVGQAVGQPLAQLLPGWTTAISNGGASTSSDTPGEEVVIAGRAYELTVSALPDRQGQPTGVLLIARDVSERRLAERNLRDSLAREQAASEHLRALDEMKTTFLQAVSHDLRTPLTTVLGVALTLERRATGLPADDVADLLHRLSSNARKLDGLLADLLDLDRLARGTLVPRRQVVDVGELTRRVVDEAGVAGEHAVVVTAPTVRIAVDAPKVERIVENLVVNAARHTPAGTTIWVRVEPRRDGVLLVVEDEGPGVSAQLREQIFQPFRKGRNVAGHAPGSGIGLALVARFAGLHGGRAWAQDRPGGGASFRVFLPNVQIPEVAET